MTWHNPDSEYELALKIGETLGRRIADGLEPDLVWLDRAHEHDPTNTFRFRGKRFVIRLEPLDL